MRFSYWCPHYELQRATAGAAGYDLQNVGGECVIEAKSSLTILTGVYVQIPPGYFGLCVNRSGLARTYSVISNLAIIDSDYRGQIGVILFNLGRSDVKIENNERVAQLLIVPTLFMYGLEGVTKPTRVNSWDDLGKTARGSGGFGSTGK
jgi:dUTP pyrophosphatase